MNELPDPQPTAVGPTPQDRAEARRLLAALDEIPTAFRDETPVPRYGPTPPVPQPGRPAMSQKATDASVLMLSAGVASLPIGGMTALVIYTLGHADPTSLAIGAAAPAALAVPILALSRLVKRAKQAAPDVHHHHYTGTVVQDQRQVNTTTRGLIANTRNQLPK